MRLVYILAFVALLMCCSIDRFPYELEEFDVPDSGVKTLVIGDWGRKGNVNLKSNAYVMNELACRISVDAVLTTGDNFYSNGVDNTADAHWNRSFESIFNGDCLMSSC